MPKYLGHIEPYIHVALPMKTEVTLLDAASEAGGAAVCRSPMLAMMNAGDIKGRCEALGTWDVCASGVVGQDLKNRRTGDSCKGEKQLCLRFEGFTVPASPGFAGILGRFLNFIFEKA